MLLFSLDPHSACASALSAQLEEPLSSLENRAFADGEHKLRPLVDPRGHDCYVLASLYGEPAQSPHDKLVQLLMFIAALRDHGAARVTAVLPYLAYARKDRQTKPFDPVGSRVVAQLLEAAGVQQLITLEAHNVVAYQNAFRVPTWHLAAHEAFDPVVPQLVGAHPLAVASPDPGGVKRAQLWREALQARLAREVGFAFVDKRRSEGVLSSMGLVAGDVHDATVLLLDDLIGSGETLRHAATALRKAGAREVIACAAHGLFLPPAEQTLADDAIAGILVTDSVPAFRLPEGSALRRKLQVVSAAPLLARAIRASHGSTLSAA
jgi:ribose-phosphate pyrophosphokinase